jgi:hypothetical protein
MLVLIFCLGKIRGLKFCQKRKEIALFLFFGEKLGVALYSMLYSCGLSSSNAVSRLQLQSPGHLNQQPQ